MKLRLTAPLHADETLRSFVCRFAAVNHMRTPTTFCEAVGIRPAGLDSGRRADIDRLVELTGVDEAQLRQRTVRLQGRAAALGRHTIPRSHLATGMRGCTACLEEDRSRAGPYDRLSWRIDTMEACPVHRARLETFRDHAGFPLLPRRPIEGRAIADAARRELDLFLWRHFQGETHQDHAVLGTMTLGCILSASEMIGAIEQTGHVRAAASFDIEQRRNACERGFNILQGGEATILPFLARTDEREIAEAGDRPRLYLSLGGLYIAISNSLKIDDFGKLSAIIVHHMASRSRLPKTLRLGRGHAPARRLMSLTDIAQAAQCDPVIVNGHLQELDIRPAVVRPRRVWDEADVDDLVQQLKGCQSLSAWGEEAGVPPFHLRCIEELGLVEPITTRRQTNLVHRFTGDSLDLLKTRPLGSGNVVSQAPNDHVPLVDCRYRIGARLADILGWVADGSLDTLRLAGASPWYRSILISTSEVDRLFNAKAAAATGLCEWKGEEAVSIAQACETLFINRIQLRRLRQHGQITSVYMGNAAVGPKRTLISLRSVEAFQANYITIREIAAGLHISIDDALVRLEQAGIKPRHKRTSYAASIYSRSDTQTILSGR